MKKVTTGMRHLIKICALWLFASIAWADSFVIIAHPELKANTLTRGEVINIYMGRQKTIGETFVLPMDLTGSEKDRAVFYRLLTGKSISEINSYWARVMFSGSSAPPRPVTNYDEMIRVVEQNLSAIGYIPATQVNNQVKVLFRLEAL